MKHITSEQFAQYCEAIPGFVYTCAKNWQVSPEQFKQDLRSGYISELSLKILAKMHFHLLANDAIAAGWTDLQIVDGKLWGFAPGDVMPQPWCGTQQRETACYAWRSGEGAIIRPEQFEKAIADAGAAIRRFGERFRELPLSEEVRQILEDD